MAALVSFQLRHPSMDLAPIASELGLPVARIWIAGMPRQTPKGDPLKGVYDKSYCALKVVTAEGTIPAAITVVDTALRRAVSSYPVLKGGQLDKCLYCTLMDQGETIDCESLGRLFEWRIEFGIDGCSNPYHIIRPDADSLPDR